MKRIILTVPAVLLLTACGTAKPTVSEELQYIKTSVLYDTIVDMYNDPDSYVGGNYHMVGELYPSQDDDGETFYSIYTESSGEGIGIELDWDDFSGFSDYDTVTVEGRLEIESGMHNGAETQYLILRVTMLEKRTQ